MPANARSHAVLTTESKVTIRGQTTIPAPVREALKLKPGQDSIHYEILPGGQVFMCRLGDEQEDHTMNAFLRFLDALAHDFRFLSYGDSSLLFRQNGQ